MPKASFTRFFFDRDFGELWRYDPVSGVGEATANGDWSASDKPHAQVTSGRGGADEITEAEAAAVERLFLTSAAESRPRYRYYIDDNNGSMYRVHWMVTERWNGSAWGASKYRDIYEETLEGGWITEITEQEARNYTTPAAALELIKPFRDSAPTVSKRSSMGMGQDQSTTTDESKG